MSRLEDFIVLERLRVHKIQVKPRRVSATYEVTHPDGRIETNVLFYTYNDMLFDPLEQEDLNLASMMLSQVALNYGLFCRELIFDGFYDKADKAFIKSMIENTSREILTNKLMCENPFLIPPYDQLQVTPQDSYTQANILFPREGINLERRNFKAVKPDMGKYAILSSGGKDSLLSYGLISEFGEPHPVFVNEAGRHWFTAINSFRALSNSDSRTKKAWCNGDRIFNWMVRQLPFVRKNYASIRADIYPVRLWTVAVFLFGVLPLALNKGLGNIIIGDEYDTTERKSLNGIQHYNGLYDQSKYFDNALTRYYLKKGWGLFQYSMLRSMSELLIMKTLLKRYPHLQSQQISCHAAHSEKKRMYPCGNCEKCRRIIGMICALDEDPKNCGYTDEQISKALSQISQMKLKQIGSDAAHLYYLLVKKHLIRQTDFTRKMAREHPRVMQLRFDNERSTLEDLPMHVRKPLFDILLRYSRGAVRKDKQTWEALEVDDHFLKSKNYKYDA